MWTWLFLESHIDAAGLGVTLHNSFGFCLCFQGLTEPNLDAGRQVLALDD